MIQKRSRENLTGDVYHTSNSRHPTKPVLLMLDKLIHNISGTSVPPPRTVRIIIPPPPELLAEKGRMQVGKLMFITDEGTSALELRTIME